MGRQVNKNGKKKRTPKKATKKKDTKKKCMQSVPGESMSPAPHNKETIENSSHWNYWREWDYSLEVWEWRQRVQHELAVWESWRDSQDSLPLRENVSWGGLSLVP